MIAKNMFSLVAAVFLSLSSYWLSMVIALPFEKRDGNSANDVVGNIGHSITVHKTIAGLIFIGIGLLYTFYGKRFFKITIFCLGFYIGAIITWTILVNHEPQDGYGTHSDTVILLSTLGAGLLIGSLFVCCADFAFWLLGALAGYALAIFILALRDGGLIQSKAGKIVFILIFIIAGGILAIIFHNPIIILSTAFIGALSTIIGIDMFANTGFTDALQCFVDGNHDVIYHTSTKVYLMLLGVVLFAVAGALYQFRFHKNRDFGRRGAQHPTPHSTTPEEKRSWYQRLTN